MVEPKWSKLCLCSVKLFDCHWSKQKGENFYLGTFGGEHKEAGSAGDYATEKKEEDVLTAKTLLWIIGN